MTKKERESQRERQREKKNCPFRKILSMEKMSCLEKEVMISDKFIFMNFVFLSDETFVSNEKNILF